MTLSTRYDIQRLFLTLIIVCILPLVVFCQSDTRQENLDRLMLITPNGSRVFLGQYYSDLVNQSIDVVREFYVGSTGFKIVEFQFFSVQLDEDSRVRNIYFENPGPKLDNGIQVGLSIDFVISMIESDTKLTIETFKDQSGIVIRFADFEADYQAGFVPEPMIVITYDSQGTIDYVNFGFESL